MRNTECWNDSLTSQLSTRLIRMEMMAIPITSYDASFPIPIPIPNLPNHIFCPLDWLYFSSIMNFISVNVLGPSYSVDAS